MCMQFEMHGAQRNHKEQQTILLPTVGLIDEINCSGFVITVRKYRYVLEILGWGGLLIVIWFGSTIAKEG